MKRETPYNMPFLEESALPKRRKYSGDKKKSTLCTLVFYVLKSNIYHKNSKIGKINEKQISKIHICLLSHICNIWGEEEKVLLRKFFSASSK